MKIIKEFLLIIFIIAVGHTLKNNHQFTQNKSQNNILYQVYIHQLNDTSLTSQFGCSGVIIDSYHILTHSSCIKIPIELNKLIILTDPVFLYFDNYKNYDIIDGTSEHNVTKIIFYKPTPNKLSSKNLTILKLDVPISYPAYIKPIISSAIYNDNSFATGEFINIDDKKTSSLFKLFKQINMTLNCNSKMCDFYEQKKDNHKSKILPGSPMIHDNKVVGIFNKKNINSSVIDYIKIDSNVSLWIDKITDRAKKTNDNVFQDQSIYQVFVEVSQVDLFIGCEIFNGVIINSNHILTEANSLMVSVENIKVLIPSNYNNLRHQFQRINVVKAIQHPEFNSTSGENNIAILKIKENIDFSSNLLPITLEYFDLDENENHIISIDKSVLLFRLKDPSYSKLYFQTKLIKITDYNDKDFVGVEIRNNNDEYQKVSTIIKNSSYALMNGILVGVSCCKLEPNKFTCQKISNYESWFDSLSMSS